jgi:two-component system, cell cycle response regulator
MMPVMDGFTTCRRLKENEATQLIPIIIMTVLRETDDRIKGSEAGADDFLTKLLMIESCSLACGPP